MKTSPLLPVHLAIFLFLLITFQTEAVHRKCLEDKNCDDDECCAMAFYLFRCEKRGLKEGDSCGLCGCTNSLSCVSEGISPWRVLSGRGVCRPARRPSQSHLNQTTATPITANPAPCVTQQDPNPTVPVILTNLLANNRGPPRSFRGATP